ncbi:threonine ammonia-lyase, biosynthetic [Thiolapillus brandeum]|uniref:L-threonine dehydratase n=1 Tax=Thiolapillus brandeum TaxID=1076588 RepID=A0A7U6GGB3_9GAMM|nr:threonine ammonia-lyase, biosynthetic [Thiolapillus brandeum]BAO43093.1 threonine dehydratase [Thiolapillus brandeum]
MSRSYLEKILRARVYDVARETPLDFASRLSARLGTPIWLKREDMQSVFSFKLRGAYNKIYNLPEKKKRQGVIAASAGNHAQGVALAGKRLGVPALIVMPTTTPPIKVQTVRNLGAKIILHGDSYDDAYEHARTLVKEKGLTFVHPFDDPDVIAGQGTVATEVLRQHEEPIEAVFIPVGGGGLIAGMAAYIKRVRPEIKIIGVEPEDTPTLHHALQAGRRVSLKQIGLFADGVAVRQIGKETFKLARDLVDEVVLVTTDEICAAIKDIYDDTRSVAEPAGALGIAGIKKYLQKKKNRNKPGSLISVLSGANINFDRLRHVSERAELGEQREALFAVEIPERPGSFLSFCRLLGKRNVTEFNYRYFDDKRAHVFCGIELSDGSEERDNIIERLQGRGFGVTDLTDNETAKLHIRYMVGGHAPQVKNERLYRFVFPERPGALLDFLSGLTRGWNISLFHYRNHGAAYGRVLVGVQLNKAEAGEFRDYLRELGYRYHEETGNPAYQLFAGAG